MAPTFQALPKHQERLQTLAAKHLLHSYFNLNYGLKIEGLQFHTSQRDPNAQALESLALLRRAPKLKAALQESSKGFHLKELASIALLLNRPRERPFSGSGHDWDQVIIHSESLKRGASPAFHERFRIGQDFAMGHIKSWWNLRNLVGYLQKLDAIDTFYPKNPSVIVTNYVDGSHNCVAGNANFALCCISDCISILRTYEQEVQEPHTTPEEVLRITKTMPGRPGR
eukprot:g18998.t1